MIRCLAIVPLLYGSSFVYTAAPYFQRAEAQYKHILENGAYSYMIRGIGTFSGSSTIILPLICGRFQYA